MPGHRQQTALRQLEALFEEVSLDQQPQQPQHKQSQKSSRVVRIETKVDKCCEVHGVNRSREGTPTKTVTTTITTTNVTSPPGRRGSLQMPATPAKKDSHPSNFASSLRKDFLCSSTSSITQSKKEPMRAPSPSVRRDNLGRSMSSLKKESAYDAPKKTPSPSRGSGTFSPSLSSTAKIREKLSSELMSKSTSSLKLSSTNKVGFKGDPKAGSVSNLGKTARISSSLYDSRKFSADSLENLSKKSWDHTRRGSSGSSGGSPIWEERDFETSVDEVCIH